MSAPGPIQPDNPQGDVETLLHDLLPRFYWLYDALSGGALAALVSVLADQYSELRTYVDEMYDDLFIDTCSEGIVPYIGDQLGVTGLAPLDGPAVSYRTWVGRILGFRRRKGTLATLGRSVAAATGWAVFVQNGWEAVAHTQSVDHPTTGGGLVDISALSAGAAPGDPWSTAARSASIVGRPLVPGRPMVWSPAEPAGFAAPRSVGVTVWRLQSFAVSQRTPRAITSPGAPDGRAYSFHPLGLDSALFTVPATTLDPTQPPSPTEIPMALTIGALPARLLDDSMTTPAPVTVRVAGADGMPAPIPAHRIRVGDLSSWVAATDDTVDAVIDPVLGRFVLTDPAPGSLNVDYAYGFSGELGGGPYGPPSNFNATAGPTVTLHVAATASAANPTGNADRPYPTIDQALAAAPSFLPSANCFILVDDSATYAPTNGQSGWEVTNTGAWILRIQSAAEVAPTLDGQLRIQLGGGARVELSGLMIAGPVTTSGSGQLAVEHCTVPPAASPSLTVTTGGTDSAQVSLTYCIVGPIVAGAAVQLSVHDSIVDGLGSAAIGATGQAVGNLDIQRVTVFGSTTAATCNAEDSIFTGPLTASQPEDGLVRYCSVPPGSAPPTLIQCQSGAGRLRPRFTSTTYGDAGYGQLHPAGPDEIAQGGSLGGEMGAFNWLQQPARASRLPTVLGEMLPAGVAASITFRS